MRFIKAAHNFRLHKTCMYVSVHEFNEQVGLTLHVIISTLISSDLFSHK